MDSSRLHDRGLKADGGQGEGCNVKQPLLSKYYKYYLKYCFKDNKDCIFSGSSSIRAKDNRIWVWCAPKM